MPAGKSCKLCGTASSNVEKMISLGDGVVCKDCVSLMAQELGLFPASSSARAAEMVPVHDNLDLTFTYTFELEGHIDQKYDVFLLQCFMDILRTARWDVAIELARLTRTDGFERRRRVFGGRRYAVDLLVRAEAPVTEDELRDLLDSKLPPLITANALLLGDKSTRDLLEPRLASLASFVVRSAGLPAA